MIRKEMATANRRSRAQADTVNGAGSGFAFFGSALSMFVGSTEGKGKFNLVFILAEILQATVLIDLLAPDLRISEYIIEAYSAGFVEML
jgi:hypothetical protein